MALKKVENNLDRPVSSVSRDYVLRIAGPQLNGLSYCYLPEVEKVEAGAFFGCRTLKEVHFPSSLKRLEQEAIAQTGLINFQASRNLEYIGNNCFHGCQDLETVSIPGVKEIGTLVFCDCTNLKTIVCQKEIAEYLRSRCLRAEFIEPENPELTSGELFQKIIFEKISKGDYDSLWSNRDFDSCKCDESNRTCLSLVKGLTISTSKGKEEIDGNIVMKLIPINRELYQAIGFHSYRYQYDGFYLDSVRLLCGREEILLSEQEKRDLFDFCQLRTSKKYTGLVIAQAMKGVVNSKFPNTKYQLKEEKKNNKEIKFPSI